jgi:uncharacterized protein (TIGR03492 family)
LHVCFLSNGYGEDKAATAIAGKLREICPSVEITGAPLVTPGDDFTKQGFEVLIHGEVPPSGGFPLKSLRGLLLDTLFTPKYCRYYERLKQLRAKIDYSVVVGDVSLLTMAHFALRKKPVFVELAKSSYKGPHFRPEEAMLRRFPQKVITRDQCTCDYLRGKRVDAIFLGNPMMDGLISKGLDLGNEPIVGILPGSREEAYENLRRILLAVDRSREDATFVCGLPSCLSVQRIADTVEADGWVLRHNALSKNGKVVSMIEDGFADVITKSQVIIGLAGTANEQAVGLGTPVITFAGSGAQTTVRRMRSQQRLLGESVKFVQDVPDGVVSELSLLLSDADERARRGRIGMQRMGPPGGSEAIARFLAGQFGLAPSSEIAA